MNKYSISIYIFFILFLSCKTVKNENSVELNHIPHVLTCLEQCIIKEFQEKIKNENIIFTYNKNNFNLHSDTVINDINTYKYTYIYIDDYKEINENPFFPWMKDDSLATISFENYKYTIITYYNNDLCKYKFMGGIGDPSH